MTDVTQILNAIEQGDAQAADKLLPLVYGELRLLAAQKLSREPPGQTLEATALVHEAYIKLVGDQCRNWSNRGHFFATAAEAMRRLLVDNARRKKSERRGGRRQKVDLDNLRVAIENQPDDLIELDEALTRLAGEDADVADLVKLHYFGGLTLEQAAEVKGISRRTASRNWNYARLWLFREMTRADETSA